MHIPDGILSPTVAATTGALAAAGLLWGLRTLERRLRERTTVLTGTMAAFLFAAQMVKFPVGPGVAGHLMGGTLAAALLGPWAGAVAVAAVLVVQCLLFGDGGLTALGANFLNMGLIGAVGGYALYTPIRRAIGGRAGVVLGAMAAAWFTVILGAGAFAVELAASVGWGRFLPILGWMTLVHAAIGVGEALITGLVLRSLLLTRPDLVDDPDGDEAPRSLRVGQAAVAGLVVALAVATFLAPLALLWDRPDGLEFVAHRLGLPEGATALRAPIPDYHVPGLRHVAAATAAAGLAGTLVVFGLGLGLSRAFAPRRPAAEIGPDAA
jgi:cobalt/nickel transport system permease protein